MISNTGVVNIGAKKLVLVFRVVRALVICFWSIILVRYRPQRRPQHTHPLPQSRAFAVIDVCMFAASLTPPTPHTHTHDQMAVIFLWILCLPVGTSWICRLYFLRSLNGLFRFRQRLQLGALVSDWMQGLLLSLLVVTVFLAVSGLREYMLRQERQQQQQQENNQNPNNAQDQADANPDVIPRRRQNDDAVEEVAMGNWGDDELPVDLEDFSAALPRAGTMHDEVTEVEGVAEDQFGEEDLGEVYNVDAVDQDLLRQRHLLQLQQRLRQQQALLAEAREQQREAEAVRAAARDEARAMAAAAEEEEEQRRQLEMHADNDDMMLGFLDVREEEVCVCICVFICIVCVCVCARLRLCACVCASARVCERDGGEGGEFVSC